MVSAAVNVLRYTALAVGVLYGVQHQRTLYKKEQKHKDSEEYAHKEALIRKAKEEYKKKTSPPSVITDPEDSRFDLEKFLLHIAEQKH